MVVRPPRCHQVDGEIRHRLVLHGLGPADDPVDSDVRRQIPVGRFELLEREVQFGLAHTLAKKIIKPISHLRHLR